MLQLHDLDIHKKRVLIRVDFNVPLQDDRIVDPQRIQASLPAIQHVLAADAAVILVSHLGRPTEGEFDEALSLKPIADYLTKNLNQPVTLIKDWQQGIVIKAGEIILLENIRFYPGEKENAKELSKQLASLCDVFVMDAFATAHRAHASTHGVAHYAKVACAGPLLTKELTALKKALHKPATPMSAIVGGAKVSTKLTVLQQLLHRVDQLIVGGGIANTFLLAKNYNIGQSLHESALLDQAKQLLADDKQQKIVLPLDVITAKACEKDAVAEVKPLNNIADDDLILDVGPKSSKLYTQQLNTAKTILWNGPLGVFELPAFANGTNAIAQAIASSDAFSIAGGGDTLAAINKFHVNNDISYISTGGGAFLEYIEGKTLPAVEVLA